MPRAQFVVADRHAYLNHAEVAPLPKVACSALTEYAAEMCRRGSLASPEHVGRVEQVRARAAALLGVSADDVALVKNTTHALSLIASGLSWRPGDRVVVPACEYAANVSPWLALEDRGVTVDFIRPVGRREALPLEIFDECLTRRPARLVAVSWVQFGRGWRTDMAGLARICHEHGALLCVDVVQGAGVLPADLAAWGVDFAAGGGHKWLLGPQGVGVLYVAPHCHDLLHAVTPPLPSGHEGGGSENLDLRGEDSAQRFEAGSRSVGLVCSLGGSLELLLQADPEAVWSHVDGLAGMAADALARAGAELLSDRNEGRSGIVTFTVPGLEPARVCALLRGRGVVVSARGGGVRVSPHGYNDEEDILALVRAVADLRG